MEMEQNMDKKACNMVYNIDIVGLTDGHGQISSALRPYQEYIYSMRTEMSSCACYIRFYKIMIPSLAIVNGLRVLPSFNYNFFVIRFIQATLDNMYKKFPKLRFIIIFIKEILSRTKFSRIHLR